MQLRKTCSLFMVMILTVITLCSCTRYNPPVESYEASQSAPVESAPQDSAGVSLEDRQIQSDFDALTNEIFKEELMASPLSLHCILRYPENYGIEITEPVFEDFSVDTLKQSAEERRLMLQRLESMDSSRLTAEQRLTFQMLKDYLEVNLEDNGLELFAQNISPTIGIQAQLPIIFAEYAFYDKQDVENYLSLLGSIDTYYKKLADFEAARVEAGLGMSDQTLDRVILSCQDYLIRPESSFLTETFSSKLADIPDLTEEEKNELKARHLSVLKEHFIPAYDSLTASLQEFKGKGLNDGGLCHYTDGRRYYEYLVRSKTGTDSTVAELEARVEGRLQEDMAQITLLSQNNQELASATATFSPQQSDPIQILNHLRTQCENDFPALTSSDFIVKDVPKALESTLSPAFFLTPPIDYGDTGTIYINGAKEQDINTLYTTLAHEGYPGHLYQALYNVQNQTVPLRSLLGCNGYAEGWGTYAELYSFSFDNGMEKDLQQLLAYSEASVLGIYALLDIRIHYSGWELADTTDYLNQYFSINDPAVTNEIFQSIVENPANYLSYYTGYLEIKDMEELAADTLKERYNIKAFHKFILDMEGASFRIIKPHFQTWLLTYDQG